MNFKSVLLLALVLFVGCTSQKNPNQFSDPGLVKIADLQDRRQTDSLLLFLNHANAQYRGLAALALASVQDSTASRSLGNLLLEDTDTTVQRYAAFALGQTKGYESVNALTPALTNTHSFVLREVLEALGKTLTAAEVPSLLGFSPKDSLAEEGLAWGIYRLGVRGLANDACVAKAITLIDSSKSYQCQLASAHFFNRANVTLPTEIPAALLAATRSRYADVRMVATQALRKFAGPATTTAIMPLLSDTDYRVRVNAARALRAFAWADTNQGLKKALNDAQVNVSIAAAEVIRTLVTKENVDTVLAWARTVRNPRSQAHLYEGVLGVSATAALVQEAQNLFSQSKDDYQKAWLLAALGNAPFAAPFIVQTLAESNVKVIKTSAAAALVQINKNPKFDTKQKSEFAAHYQRALADGDVGVIISVCEALKDPSLGYKGFIKDIAFLKDARQRLSLPRDIEAIQPLDETIAFFEDRNVPPIEKKFNHPINWDSVKKIPADQRVLINTTKGEIEMVLFVNEEQGSVLNFVQLVSSHYFDGRFFHRVVPNFVIQAGCNRGDGFGSEDYSIRSEFTTRRYKTGSVGMASAGKDTEGTQWFITHSPTPHLDGAYTIFAEVVRGMDVVHQMEVGDQILTASLIRN